MDAADTPKQPTQPRRRYAKGEATRQEILDRTIEVLAKRGAQRTSLRAIASEIGITHAALTYYFGSLDQLLIEVYRHWDTREDPPPSLTRAPVEGMLDSARGNRDVPGLVQLYTSLCAAALDDNRGVVQDYIAQRFARIREEVAHSVRRCQTEGSIRSDIDPHAAAALIIAASDGLQIQWLLDGDAPQTEALALLQKVLS
ncbi:TetR/AcrR family transcriptional regulator [Actinomycetaceae bacterium WB03_NA08]|uniref:TetR/AcrR family transcriptional regulator n=1 Tax=Scrofimicrobium canadense TaxID=2652290 RepID=A0A6N7W460_9ACTO|nr:TetR/AcrR family transcriptional regulator [Scrofimicrobium canadense]MSS83242.1 TetR/AcrR family transcriptional regulator [Scrofimicrobium canadense]